MNNSIWAAEKSFDIGCRVIKWNELEGFSFNKNFIARNWDYNVLKQSLTQFTTHWSATYKAKHTYTGLMARSLSVNFIINDDCNSEGYATIYQCLDLKHSGWSQGNGMNSQGAGVEISYQPQAWEENMYDENDQKKWNVPPHNTIVAPIHGTTLRVYLPTDAQMNSLIQLIWGYCELFPKVKPEFPKDNSGNFITTSLKNPLSYHGLMNHYNFKKGKVDCCGLDMKKIEEEVKKRIKTGY